MKSSFGKKLVIVGIPTIIFVSMVASVLWSYFEPVQVVTVQLR